MINNGIRVHSKGGVRRTEGLHTERSNLAIRPDIGHSEQWKHHTIAPWQELLNDVNNIHDETVFSIW